MVYRANRFATMRGSTDKPVGTLPDPLLGAGLLEKTGCCGRGAALLRLSDRSIQRPPGGSRAGPAGRCRRARVGRRAPASGHPDLHAVDRREGLEEAIPLLAAVAADPELAGGGADVKGRRLQIVDGHRVAQDGEVGVLLREPLREALPGAAAVGGAPDRRR